MVPSEKQNNLKPGIGDGQSILTDGERQSLADKSQDSEPGTEQNYRQLVDAKTSDQQLLTRPPPLLNIPSIKDLNLPDTRLPFYPSPLPLNFQQSLSYRNLYLPGYPQSAIPTYNDNTFYRSNYLSTQSHQLLQNQRASTDISYQSSVALTGSSTQSVIVNNTHQTHNKAQSLPILDNQLDYVSLKKQSRRERNREAATRYRLKQIERKETLEAKLQQLLDEQDKLRQRETEIISQLQTLQKIEKEVDQNCNNFDDDKVDLDKATTNNDT